MLRYIGFHLYISTRKSRNSIRCSDFFCGDNPTPVALRQPLRGIGERYALISSVLCNPASLCRMAGVGKYLICNELLITPG